jgi:hypothetical protein
MEAASRTGLDWNRLSDIGQAFGGVSAVLSALAFCAIAASLLLQWRQLRMTTVIAARERHFDLVRLAVDDPLPDAGKRDQRVWVRRSCRGEVQFVG